jgi:CDP-diacylglycerol--glycerol-3-phosphate 3-phosphatidyltransferase
VNFLSIFRILSAFAIVPLLLEQCFDWAFAIFVIAAATDWFDGFLARKYKVATKIGGVLDHMGDKLLVVNALIMMVMFLQILIVIIPAILMICRELYVSGLREFMGTQKIEMGVPKARFSVGKIKTAIQVLALSVLFLWIWAVNSDWNSVFFTHNLLVGAADFWIGLGCPEDIAIIVGGGAVTGLWLAALCSVISAIQYTKTFANNLKKLKITK